MGATQKELQEHAAGVLFDSQASYDSECLLCQLATAAGCFERYGYTRAMLLGQE